MHTHYALRHAKRTHAPLSPPSNFIFTLSKRLIFQFPQKLSRLGRMNRFYQGLEHLCSRNQNRRQSPHHGGAAAVIMSSHAAAAQCRRRAVAALILVTIIAVATRAQSTSPSGIVRQDGFEFQPSILSSVIWPWSSPSSSSPPSSSLDVAYANGTLSPSFEDISWDSEVNLTAACPKGAMINVTADLWESIAKPRCVEAATTGQGGVSFSSNESFGDGDALDFWVFIPSETHPHPNASLSPHHDVCSGHNASEMCSALRLLAGPVGEDSTPDEASPLLLFLHASKVGSNIFSVPILTVAPDLKQGDWSHVVVPLGDSGWGGDHDWKRISLMPSLNASSGIRFFLGRIAIQRAHHSKREGGEGGEGGGTHGGNASIPHDGLVGGNGAHGGGRSGTASARTPAQPIARPLYDEAGFAPGVSDWSWLANVTTHNEGGSEGGREGGEGGGLCASLESLGGLSLKASSSFGAASVLKFQIKPPKEPFFINARGRVQPIVSLRLDATREKVTRGGEGGEGGGEGEGGEGGGEQRGREEGAEEADGRGGAG